MPTFDSFINGRPTWTPKPKPRRKRVAGKPVLGTTPGDLQVYGANITYDKGFDAEHNAVWPDAEGLNASGTFIRADQARLDVWIENISAEFSVNGQLGQGRTVREFFPRSFNDVSVVINGRVANTQQYNELATFVRYAQVKAITNTDSGSTIAQDMQFVLHNNTPKTWGSKASNVKGAHRPWILNGYIQSIAAGAVKHEVAPQFQIVFLVAESNPKNVPSTGIWSDIAATQKPLAGFLEIFSSINQHRADSGFVDIPAPLKRPAQQPSNPFIATGALGYGALIPGIGAIP